MNISLSYKVRLIIFNVICCLLVSGIVAVTGFGGIKTAAVYSFSDRGRIIMDKANELIDVEKYVEISKSLDENDP